MASVLREISKIDRRFYDAIKLGFDDSASKTEDIAIRFGKAASPDHLVKAIRIVEELRTATLGNHDKPRHSIRSLGLSTIFCLLIGTLLRRAIGDECSKIGERRLRRSVNIGLTKLLDPSHMKPAFG